MLGLVKPLAGWMVLTVLMGTLGFLAAQFIPILGAYGILCGLENRAFSPLWLLWASLIACALLRAVFRLIEQRTNHYIAFTLLAIVRDKVFKALRKLCPAKLEGRDKGDLISLITSDVELLEVFYAHTISPICIAVLTSGIMCVYIGHFHWSLGLLALVAFLVVGVVLPLVISKQSGTVGDALRAQSGELAAFMLENLALANTLILLFDAAMLLLSGSLYLNGTVGFDGFLIPLIALMSSFGPVIALANLGTTLQSTTAAASRVLSLLDEKPQTQDITGREDISFTGAELRDVSFSYSGETILDQLSVSFPKNTIVGIVGKSGCGKSTMMKLLMRFWKANKGSVSISNRSVEEINTSNLRAMESYMTQDTQLFMDTIANNIRIAKLSASDKEVDTVISMEQGRIS